MFPGQLPRLFKQAMLNYSLGKKEAIAPDSPQKEGLGAWGDAHPDGTHRTLTALHFRVLNRQQGRKNEGMDGAFLNEGINGVGGVKMRVWIV